MKIFCSGLLHVVVVIIIELEVESLDGEAMTKVRNLTFKGLILVEDVVVVVVVEAIVKKM